MYNIHCYLYFQTTQKLTTKLTPPPSTKVKPQLIPISSGEFNILPMQSAPCNCQPITDGVTVSQSNKPDTSSMVSIQVTIIAGISSFCVGAGLVGILWCVYMKTDPRQQMQAVSMSDDAISAQDSTTTPTEKLMSYSTEPSASSFEV